jgi:hypothetical protein
VGLCDAFMCVHWSLPDLVLAESIEEDVQHCSEYCLPVVVVTSNKS